MTYDGYYIGYKPDRKLVEMVVADLGCNFDIDDFFAYWGKRDWLTKKKKPIKTLEAAVASYNSLFVQKLRKRGILENYYKKLEAEGKGHFVLPDDIPHVR